MYDLEKDIKNLTLQFEEILFKLDDMSNNISTLETELISKLEIIQINSKNISSEKSNEIIINTPSTKEDNVLGKLVISDDKKKSTNVETVNLIEEKDQVTNLEDSQNQVTINMPPEEHLQFALDQLRKKNFDKSKKILENFVIKFPDNQLSGSAYFWLGKIYLFESNYRDAALVFGEGVQKFPKSIKASEMYYELVKSLKEMNKIPEACKTFSLFKDNYNGDKFTKDPDKIMDKLTCEN